MTTVVAFVSEHGGRSLVTHATELASYAWLVVIGVPETVTHARTFLRCCRQWLAPPTKPPETYWRDASDTKGDHDAR